VRWLDRVRLLWKLAKTERASPPQVAWAVGVGVFAGCTPAVGVHGWVAVGAATLFRLNRLYAFLGSRISSIVILPWIVLAEIQVAHRIRTGSFVALTKKDVLDHAREYLLDWCIGTLPVGGALAAIFALSAYAWAVRRARRERSEQPPAEDPAP